MVRRKTHAEFVAEVEALVGDEYTVLGEYVTARTHIEMIHNSCGHIYRVLPNKFISHGNRCPKCNHLNFSKIYSKTTEVFKKEVYELVGNEYEVLGKYVGAHKKITMKHSECGYIYGVTPCAFTSTGCRCPKCSRNNKKTTEVFKKEVYELVGNEYEVLGEYTGANKKIEMKHSECGYIYEAVPSKFIIGTRCPNCNESKGEHQVAETLSNMHIPYARQHKFDDCRNINRLPFDFAVFNVDKSLKCLIEYDGEQHFVSKKIFGGEKGFKIRQHCDAIKTKYCADHNIPLIRIPFWEFDNIDAILTKELRKLGVIETEAIAS